MSSGKSKRKILISTQLVKGSLSPLTDAEVVSYFSRIYKYDLYDTIYHLHLSFQIRKRHVLLLVALLKRGHSGSC